MTSRNWQAYAACNVVKTKGEDIFFDLRRAQEAKAICGRCEVSTICLYFTLMMESPRQRHGVFGQSTPDEREAMNISEVQAASMFHEDVELWSRHQALTRSQ